MKAPPLFLLASELPRAISEFAALSLIWPALMAAAPKGDGHSVVILPGFMGGDGSTLVLRRFLTHLGYRSQPWHLGVNTGASAQLEALMRRFYRHAQVEQAPVSIVGQSLGGIYARELAREFPGAVRSVVTLGSPFSGTRRGGTNPWVMRLFERMSEQTVDEMRINRAELSEPPAQTPVTALFSRTDGVVNWRACLEQDTGKTENIEIVSSHTGMVVQPLALHIIADRLAQPAGQWRKFKPQPGLMRWLMPNQASAERHTSGH